MKLTFNFVVQGQPASHNYALNSYLIQHNYALNPTLQGTIGIGNSSSVTGQNHIFLHQQKPT
jgi:hypothetical protein